MATPGLGRDTAPLYAARKPPNPVPERWGRNATRAMCVVDISLNWLEIWTSLLLVGFGGERFKTESMQKLSLFGVPLDPRPSGAGGQGCSQDLACAGLLTVGSRLTRNHKTHALQAEACGTPGPHATWNMGPGPLPFPLSESSTQTQGLKTFKSSGGTSSLGCRVHTEPLAGRAAVTWQCSPARPREEAN